MALHHPQRISGMGVLSMALRLSSPTPLILRSALRTKVKTRGLDSTRLRNARYLGEEGGEGGEESWPPPARTALSSFLSLSAGVFLLARYAVTSRFYGNSIGFVRQRWRKVPAAKRSAVRVPCTISPAFVTRGHRRVSSVYKKRIEIQIVIFI